KNVIYERVIPRKAKGKALLGNVALIFAYLLGILPGFWVLRISIYLSVLLWLADGILIALTTRFLRVEYEYAAEGDCFSVSKIYGKRSRRLVVEWDMKHTLMTAPATEEFLPMARRLSPEREIDVLSSPQAENVYMTVFETEEEERVMVRFEADEKTLSIMKRANPTVTTVRPLSKLIQEENQHA
ncbi:MAG: hypothetical protein IJY42_05740, partial [Clostridia bacterium]|nr:hypothetical protein [Clostridia bacterium]